MNENDSKNKILQKNIRRGGLDEHREHELSRDKQHNHKRQGDGQAEVFIEEGDGMSFESEAKEIAGMCSAVFTKEHLAQDVIELEKKIKLKLEMIVDDHGVMG